MIGRRIVIVDDHAVVRDLLRLRLSEGNRYEVVGEGSTGQDAIEVCLKVKPEILLLDMLLPGLNGCDVIRHLQPLLPDLRVLIFSGSTRLSLVAEAIRLGAAGFVGKLRPWSTVLDAVDRVAEGGRYFDPSLATVMPEGAGPLADWRKLTTREREVAQLIAEGKSTKEIASLMGRSAKTVDKHRTRMMEKLRLHDAVGVTRYAIRAGIVSLEE